MTRASDVANFTSGIGSATSPTTIGTGVTVSNSGNVTISGIVTASSFVGNVTGTATGLSGSPNVTVGNITGSAATFTNLTVNGTQTIINTTELNIADKTVGIASTSVASNTTADGSGIIIFGGAGGDKTWTWERDTGCFEYSDPNKFRGVVETVAAATTYMSGAAMVLELDVRNATTYTYTIPTGANIGIVSFKNMPADTGVQNGTTITCILTQNSAGTGNTTAATGIGTNCTVIGYEDGATVAGISTRALVGTATTVTLSTTGSDVDFVSFFIHYDGGTNTTASSYKVYATKNGGFRQGIIGV